MKRFFPSVLLAACLVACPTFVRADDRPELAVARRALPFIEKEGKAWMEERACVSCHQIPSMIWSHRSAERVGLLEEPAQRQALRDWIAWAENWEHWNQPSVHASEEPSANAVLEQLSMLLIGRPAGAPVEPGWAERVRTTLLRRQQPDGSWKAGGQFPLAKRSPREIQEVSTLWCLLGLLATEPAGEPHSAKVEQAQAWLATGSEPGQSTEWHLLNLLRKRQLGPASEVPAAGAALLRRQNPDGGWPWLIGEPSDALGTGYALYALAQMPGPGSLPARRQALAFLQKTQKPDGSWDVPSTRAKDGGQVRETTSYWGTCWAVIGLLEPPTGFAVPVPP